jgi:lysozyme family protein
LYWDRFRGDDIPSQMIACELLDIAVNLGVNRATTFLQLSLNHLNRNQKRWKDILVDGKIGPQTLEILNEAVNHAQIGERKITLALNNLQGRHYANRVDEAPEQEEFYSGWLERIILKEKA